MLQLIQRLLGVQTDTTALKQALAADDAYLIDVRTSAEFATGSVPKAINLPLGSLAATSTKLQKEKSIIVFCRSGNRSGQAKKVLHQLGFQQVINGGTWQNVLHLLQESKPVNHQSTR